MENGGLNKPFIDCDEFFSSLYKDFTPPQGEVNQGKNNY